MVWCVSRIVFPLVVIWLRRCCFLLNCVLIYFWYLIVLVIWASYGMVLAYMNVVLFRLRDCSCVLGGYRYLIVIVGCGVFGAGVGLRCVAFGIGWFSAYMLLYDFFQCAGCFVLFCLLLVLGA